MNMTDAPLTLSVSKGTQLFIDTEPFSVPVDGEDPDELERFTIDPQAAMEGKLSDVAEKIAEIAVCFEDKLNAVPERQEGFSLDGAQIELGFQLKGNDDLFIVKGEAQAHLKVRLIWARS